jgi:large subunit ribosomal protein L18
MASIEKRKHSLRTKRALRVRKSLKGNAQKPRMCVFKSNKHLSVQLIDDEQGHTIASAATHHPSLRTTEWGQKNRGAAKKLGELIASAAKEKNVQHVIFDRGSAKYHGVLLELADAARAGGLSF